jgi:EAL domain-containing protein (putative c-di-GMP-specific phosphodiesterase class I)
MKPISAEALVRWEHPELVWYHPDFIPVLEKNGYITKLDYYVWEEVCRYIVRRRKEGKENIPVSVNISGTHFMTKD